MQARNHIERALGPVTSLLIWKSYLVVVMANDASAFVSTSSGLREQGNAFYKKSQLIEAIVAYKAAATLAPEDPLPLSNLSAAYFETGQYAECIEAAEEASRHTAIDQQALQQKLDLRLGYAYLQRQECDKVLEVLLKISSTHPEWNRIGKCLDLMQVRKEQEKPRSVTAIVFSLIKDLTQYKPALQPVPEYFVFGHDIAQSLYDEALQVEVSQDAQVSFLLSGVGDARHLYHTFMNIAAEELTKPTRRTFTLVVNDRKPHVMARNLIIWILLDTIPRGRGASAQPDLRILNTICFVFSSLVMPPQDYERLQKTIAIAIAALDTGNMPTWIDIPIGMQRTAIMRVLKSWQTSAASLYTTGQIVSEVIPAMTGQSEAAMLASLGIADGGKTLEDMEKDFEIEVTCYKQTLFLAPESSVLEKDQPQLAKLWKQFQVSQNRETLRQIRSYVSQHWKPNVTTLDEDWDSATGSLSDLRPEPWKFPDLLVRNSFESSPKEKDRIGSYVEFFFLCTIAAIDALKEIKRVKVSVMLGDITNHMERWRCSPNPPSFDRIHLSNIPDYVGGSLFNFMYAVPLLKQHRASFMISRCLRNTPRWKTLESFNNEYVMLATPEHLAKLFRTRYGFNFDDPDNVGGIDQFPMTDYHAWKPVLGRPYTFDKLLARPAFNKWVYGMFFKIALPVVRDHHPLHGQSEMIYSPYNITIIFRLLSHLVNGIGYPAHWATTIIVNVLTDNVHTSARPPITSPLEISEVNANQPLKHMRTAAFQAEMTTLASLFLLQLPFALYGSDLNLPATSIVYEWTFHFDDHAIMRLDSNRADFVLLFTTAHLRKQKPQETRNACVSDELADRKGLHLVSTWTWNDKACQATFWLREDVIMSMLLANSNLYKTQVKEAIEADSWRCEILRTDDWLPATLGENKLTKKRLIKGRGWDDRLEDLETETT